MKHKNIVRGKVVAAIAFAVCLVALLIWYLQPRPATTQDGQPRLADAHQETNRETEHGIRTGTTAPDVADQKPPQTQDKIVTSSKTESVQKQIEVSVGAMNGAIFFWGCVVDQDDNPIAGAKVVLSCRTWIAQPLDASASQTKTELVTDKAGRFQLGGVSGDRLAIEGVTKTGYLLGPKAKKTFAFANSPKPFSPDPNAPEIVRMWKQGKHEPTTSHEGFYGFQPDGRAYLVDLLTGKNIEGEAGEGDLRVRITRPESIKPREKYLWTLEIAAIDGGLVEASDDFLYQAPETGYSPVLKIRMNPSDAGWTSVLKKSYYLKSRGGKIYGAIQMTVRPNYGKRSSMQTESVLNTSGSRNLEP